MIYEICPINNEENWLFFQDNPYGRLTVRDEYKDLVCHVCGKIDEMKAIARGISQKFIIKSKMDWISTSDDWICVTQRFRDIIERNKINGLQFITIPNNQNRFLVILKCLVKTNIKLAGFDYRGKCSNCGRYKEILVGPLVKGMDIPQDELTLFGSEIANENVKVSYRPIFASKLVVKLLKKEKIKGIDYVEAL